MNDVMKGKSDMRVVVLEVTESPFMASIENAENPKDYERQKLDLYRATTDPLEYLKYLKRMIIARRRRSKKRCVNCFQR